jgi:iron(III) transport system ATP-binding protein
LANTVIRLNNVTKYYEQTCAVDSVSLEVRKGEFLVLLGGSGCGKTTTLRLVAGLERPESGEVWIDGTLVTSENTWVPPEGRQIGMVFQDYALFPHLTVGQNIAFALKGLKGQARNQRVDEVLSLVGLEGKGARYPYQLSGGQQQRVALARALAAAPLVVLLDEPFSNLDAALRKSMREEVRAIVRQADAAAIFVTHDQEEAMSLADEIAVMQGGKLLQVGKPDLVYRQPLTRYLASFLGDANFLEGEAHGDTVETALGTLRLAQALQGRVTVMIRPETLSVTSDANGSAGVTDSRYFGHYRTIKLQHDSDVHLEAKVWAQHDFSPGERVSIAVQGSVMAFTV